MSRFSNFSNPSTPDGALRRVASGVCTVLTAFLLWGWMALVASPATLPVAVLAGPVVLVALGLHIVLGGHRAETSKRWVPLLALFAIVATLVFGGEPEARGSGLMLVMLAVLASRWTTDGDSVGTIGAVATAILTILFAAQGAPAVFILAAGGPLALGLAMRHHQHQLATLQASRQELIQRLQLALSQGQAGSFDLNLDTGHTEYSPRFREVLGYDGFSAFPPLPDLMDSSEIVWHEDAEVLARAVSEARQSNALIDEQLRFIGASGQPIWVRLRALPRAHASRRVNRLSGTILDVSAQHTADERTEAFLLAASRQIRAPLTSIRGVHRLLRSGAFGALPDLAQRMVAMADRNSGHLEDLIDNLMDLRRIQHRAQPFELEPTALDGLVRVAVKNVDAAHGELLEVQAVRVDKDSVIQANPTRLKSAVQQLICVASDHLCGPASTHVQVVREGGSVTLEIVRMGSAADAPVHTSIASLLERDAEPPMDDAESLALAVARARLLAMGAWIRATSTSQGSLTITVTFPACIEPADRIAAVAAERAS